GGAERFALDDGADTHAPAATVAEVLFDEVGAVTGKDDDVAEAVGFGEFDLVFQQGFAGDGDHRLGQIAQARPEARAHAAGEDDELVHRALQVLTDGKFDGLVGG